MRNASTVLLSGLMVLLGVAMVVTTVARGGGPISAGVVLGVLFCTAGGARLYLQARG